MAFSFADIASGLSTSSDTGVQVQNGAELVEIQTDKLAFMGVNGEARIKLLPDAWPADNLPIPTASLLSIASSQGLLAAAGPENLVVARTEDIRNALQEKSQDNVRKITPVATISHSRLAHVVFSADESVLVVSAQDAHSLLVFRVDHLLEAQTEPALQVATNGRGLRAIIANPAVQSAHLFACITVDGEVLLADFSNGKLVEGPNGVVLANNATSLSWSNKGKQLVVGLSDGTATQIKPDGTVVAQIPKSTAVAAGMHVSGISWLEDNTFLVIYTPNDTSTDDGIPSSEYFVITRDKKQYTFQKLPEILPAFGLERVPTFHFITRLRNWKPYISDLLLLSSTTATDIGIVSKSSQALSSNDPIVDAFTFTTTDEDSRRASLPLSADGDTSPIGMALDLSTKSGVVNPIPADPEIEETDGPVPNLMVLNNEGVLCSWWIIYNDSVRQKTTFSGFASLGVADKARAAASPTQTPSIPAQNLPVASIQAQSSTMTDFKSTFGQASSSASTPFAQASGTFGTGSSFGATTKFTGEKSSWASTGFSDATTTSSSSASAFGQPAFGRTGFGSQSKAFGTGSSAFGQNTTPAAPAFGQPVFGSKTQGVAFGANPSSASPFGAAGGSSSQSGFSSFARSGGFASASPEASTKSSSSFAQAASNNSPFGQFSSSNAFTKGTPFGGAPNTSTRPTLGGSFKLESSFKSDGTSKNDLPKPQTTSMFGSGFGDLLKTTAPTQLSPTRDREEIMGEDDRDDSGSETTTKGRPTVILASEQPQKPTTTPPATINQSKTTPAAPVSSIFGTGQQSTTTPQTSFGGVGWSFGNNSSTTPKDTPGPTKSIFGQALPPSSGNALTKPPGHFQAKSDAVKLPADPNVKSKGDTLGIQANKSAGTSRESPLPPDALSRPDFQAGDTSLSSINSSKPDDAPLPPDFIPANRSVVPEVEHAALPEDDDDADDDDASSDFEDSGEDVTQAISPADEGDDEDEESAENEEEDGDADDDDEEEDDISTEPLHSSPESSSKGENTSTVLASPTGGLFTKISSNQPTNSARPLFGEIGTLAPSFPPPKPQESPRSPSPVRNLLPNDVLRPDSRSVSAPVRARSAIDQRKLDYMQSNNAAQAAQARQIETAREKARIEVIAAAQEKAKAEEMRSLEDDEDERIQWELSQPMQPSENLGAFITYEPVARIETNKIDIPGQIERLYQDINSMIYTLGINARSLGSFLLHQKDHPKNQSWPAVLQSDTPFDALNDEWFLQDIERLHDGSSILDREVETRTVKDVAQKLEKCQNLLSSDIVDLRTRLVTLRKSIYARKVGDEINNMLSAEQTAVQHDLRTAASKVQTSLITVEDGLSLLRAKMADLQPAQLSGGRNIAVNSPKKPTVEAVTNTIAKMTNMAEKRSADVDVLEGQLKRLGLNGNLNGQTNHSDRPTTPQRNSTMQAKTPTSGTSSVFYTPKSKTGGSARSSRSVGRDNRVTGLSLVSVEDKDRWQAAAKRKRNVADALRNALLQRHTGTVVQ